MKIEVAVDEYLHAQQAEALGADRIELCANLNEGGTTPSAGLIRHCSNSLKIPIHVMIRCRPGDFHYSTDEMAVMLSDVDMAFECGANGVVFGALNSDGFLHEDYLTQFVERANKHNLRKVFHRAIDVCRDYQGAVKLINDMHFDEVLTSGGAMIAEKGVSNIRALIAFEENSLEVIAGSGVNEENAVDLCKIGIDTLHFTCRKKSAKGLEDPFSFGEKWIFDSDKLKNIRKIANLF